MEDTVTSEATPRQKRNDGTLKVLRSRTISGGGASTSMNSATSFESPYFQVVNTTPISSRSLLTRNRAPPTDRKTLRLHNDEDKAPKS
jgi:hypothetical protein